MSASFTPGQRVALRGGFSKNGEAQERFVDKVYKNGNFTLVGDERHQQWKPYYQKTARQVGSTSRYPTTVHVWDESLDQHLALERAKQAHQNRADNVANKMEGLLRNNSVRFLAADDLDALEALITRLTAPKQ